MKRKNRRILDLLTLRFPHLGREQCLALLFCGEVKVEGETVRDPAALIAENARVELQPSRYVSRGGIKLEHPLREWGISVKGKVMLDAGSSTGGFTDCLLQFGAFRVHAIDVGRNQIHPKLRADPRVFLQEGTNIMSISTLDPIPAGAVCDLSFRSLRKAAKHILSLTEEGWLVALVKPQFELVERYPEFDGVIKSDDLIFDILTSLRADLRTEGVQTLKVLESPIRGRGGNREFFFFLAWDKGEGRT